MFLILAQSIFLILFSHIVGRVINIKLCYSVFFLNCFIGLLIYFFALINFIYLGVLILNFLIPIIVLICLYFKKINFQKLLADPSFTIFLFFISFGIFFFKDLYVYGWDDLNHWALIVKELYYLKKLLFAESQVILNYYPPGISLYQYFFYGLQKLFREDVIFYGNYFLVISALLCIIGPLLELGSIKKNLTVFILIIILGLSIFSSGGAHSQSLYVDYILGIMLVSTISIYLNTSGRNKYLTLAPLMFLPLIKGTGYFISVYIIFFIFIFEFFLKEKNSKKILNILCFCFFLYLAVLFSKESWSVFFKLTFDSPIPNPSFALSSLFNMFANSGERDALIIKNYSDAFFNREIISLSKFIFINSWLGTNFSGLSVFGYILLNTILILWLLIFSKNKKFRKVVIVTFILFIILNIIYHLSLLGMYRFIFSTHEGNNLGSFDRYLATINIATLMYIFYLYIENYKEKILLPKILNLNNFFIVLLIISLNLFITGRYFHASKGGPIDKNYLEEVKQNIKYLKKIKNKNILKFYVLEQGSSGYGFRKVRYFIYPNHSNPGSHSIGKKYSNEDKWTVDLSIDEWKKILINDNYDFIYFHTKDEKFWNEFGSAFKGKMNDSNLWVIKKNNFGQVEFEPLESSKIF